MPRRATHMAAAALTATVPVCLTSTEYASAGTDASAKVDTVVGTKCLAATRKVHTLADAFRVDRTNDTGPPPPVSTSMTPRPASTTPPDGGISPDFSLDYDCSFGEGAWVTFYASYGEAHGVFTVLDRLTGNTFSKTGDSGCSSLCIGKFGWANNYPNDKILSVEVTGANARPISHWCSWY